MIEMYNVSLTYSNGVHALSDINLHIDKGEFIFVVGPTGCGKSSLMKMIYLEEFPTQGTIIVNGREVNSMKMVQVPYFRRNIGVIFQDFKLLLQKTVWENVSFALEVIGASKQEINKKVPEVLELVNLSHKAKFYPDDLSGGEQQRTSIARALVNNPSILLADEPTGNLDPDTSWEIIQLLSKINLRGTTVVVATHNKNIVNAMKQRVVAIVSGTIVSDQRNGTYNYEC